MMVVIKKIDNNLNLNFNFTEKKNERVRISSNDYYLYYHEVILAGQLFAFFYY